MMMNLRNQRAQAAKQFFVTGVQLTASPMPCPNPMRVFCALILSIILVSVCGAPRTAQAADAVDANTPFDNVGRSIQIVGGEPAEQGEWPWQVYVRSGPYMCGGTLIQQAWVVTAAHCVTNHDNEVYAPAEIRVTLGEYDRTKVDGTEQLINISEVIPHPAYNAQSNDNDIALLHLAAPATLGNGVGVILPVTTPTDDALVVQGAQAMVTGWGATREGGAIATQLMEALTPIVTNADCSLSYGTITDNMLCAGYVEGGKDACQGDSGGPLVVPTPDGSWKLAGVVSFGYGCARANFYGVYTRVANYVPWMEQWIGTSLTTPDETTTPVGAETPTTDENTSATLAPDQAITLAIASANGATLTLEIPAGTVDSETVLHYRLLDATAIQANTIRMGGLAFAIMASRNGLPLEQLTFNQPMTLTIAYTDADLNAIDDTALALFTFHAADGQWSAQGITLLEHVPAENRFVVVIDQTGDYVLGTPNRMVFLPVIVR